MKINKFPEKLEEQLNKHGILYCSNEQEYDLSKIKFIIVGDNPGDSEYKENRYFVGKSGKILKNIFEKNKWVENFYKECFIFNKTIISTKKTKDLNCIKYKLPHLFNEIQIKSAQHILAVAKKYNLPILIFGIGEIKKNKLFYEFWLELNKNAKGIDVYVFKHPSNNHFNKELNQISTSEVSIEELKKLGEENKKKFSF